MQVLRQEAGSGRNRRTENGSRRKVPFDAVFPFFSPFFLLDWRNMFPLFLLLRRGRREREDGVDVHDGIREQALEGLMPGRTSHHCSSHWLLFAFCMTFSRTSTMTPGVLLIEEALVWKGCVYSHMHVCCNVCVSFSQRRWTRYWGERDEE